MTTARVQVRPANGSPKGSPNSSHFATPAWSTSGATALQRDAGHSVDRALASPARSLDPATRTAMEPRFGRDFSRVRIHTGGQADASARALDANAYTVGRDIVFGRDRYSPHSPEGRRLLAHELTHVVQQGFSSGSQAPAQTRRLGAADDALEADAGRIADSVLNPTHAVAPMRVVAGLTPLIQRDGPAKEKETKPAAVKATGYPTAWEAAHAALAICNPKSIKSKDPKSITSSGNEYGGLIYKVGEEYFFTEAVVGTGAGDESATVDPWTALDKVPAASRSSIVGDYHTHGAPPDPKRDPREAVKDSGEDFSGHHAVYDNLLKEVTTGTEKKKGDIYEVRNDLTRYKANILNPETYTAFLATPTGRFTLFIPKKNIVFSFSPDPRLVPPEQKPQAAAYAH
jgi:hypothetical protein